MYNGNVAYMPPTTLIQRGHQLLVPVFTLIVGVMVSAIEVSVQPCGRALIVHRRSDRSDGRAAHNFDFVYEAQRTKSFMPEGIFSHKKGLFKNCFNIDTNSSFFYCSIAHAHMSTSSSKYKQSLYNRLDQLDATYSRG